MLNEARLTRDSVVKQVRSLESLLSYLKDIYNVRKSQYLEFQDNLSTSASFMFMELMKKRKFKGKLKFDHERGLLTLNVLIITLRLKLINLDLKSTKKMI